MKQPHLGNIVFFVDPATLVPLVALVVRVWTPQTVNLFVLPNGSEVMGLGYLKTSAVYAEVAEEKPASWHWPEAV